MQAFFQNCIERWSIPRYALDTRFVNLTLLLDQSAEGQGPRRQAKSESFQTLQQVLATTTDPLVLLGDPGCGKSTLLRHYELENAQTGLAELEHSGKAKPHLTFFIQLNGFKGTHPDDPPPRPLVWLSERWAQQNPNLPNLPALMKAGRITLLLDALNEIPYRNAEVIQLWKDFLSELETFHSATRVIFSCRSLDSSALLSSKDRPVPQVRIESLSDDKVRQFLLQYSPSYGETLWENLRNTAQLNVFRSPYFLKMLIAESIGGQIPSGRAALFTAFVRRLITRENEAGNELFQSDELLQEADIQWLIYSAGADKLSCELPERGILVPKLAKLAYEMQLQRKTTESGQVKINYDQALSLLNHSLSDKIIDAGLAMHILEKEPGSKHDQIFYLHQLIQEYFAARHLMQVPQPAGLQRWRHKLNDWLGLDSYMPPNVQLANQEWRSDRVTPSLDETLATLPDSDPLPPLPVTGWEETLALASAMVSNTEDFIRQLMAVNLALAGRCAAQPDVRISDELRTNLQRSLVKRTQNPKADLRARIAAGFSLGEMGDPRFQKQQGPYGAFLLSPLITIPGGSYTIGSDEGIYENQAPIHSVTLNTFQMAQFPVTNAEYGLFINAHGYDNERWWPTEAAQKWRCGENTSEGPKLQGRQNREYFQKIFSDIRELQRQGQITSKQADDWEQIAQLSDEAFEVRLVTLFPDGRLTVPAYWYDDVFNRAAQPVVGICRYEALAYCTWLSAQSGLSWRLPSEAEWEAAARGKTGRRYAYGDDFNVKLSNTFESHIRATTPINVFPGGETPEGLADMCGNVWEWTSSLHQAYPYDPNDGRENHESKDNRIVRGGSWRYGQDVASAAYRGLFIPGNRDNNLGFRLVCSSPPSETLNTDCRESNK